MRLHTKGSEDSLLLKKTGTLEIGGQQGPSPPSNFRQEKKQNLLLQKISPGFSDNPTGLKTVLGWRCLKGPHSIQLGMKNFQSSFTC